MVRVRAHRRRGTSGVKAHSRLIEGTKLPVPTRKEILKSPNYKEGYDDGKRVINTYGYEVTKNEWLPFFKRSLKEDRGHVVATQGTIVWEVKTVPYLTGKIKGIEDSLKKPQR